MPRLQNDERFKAPQIDALLRDAVARNDAHTVDLLRPAQSGARISRRDRCDCRRDARAIKLDFGTIETYDVKQNQAGSESLAKDLPDRTVRVQAIAKAEHDKLRPEEIVQRYDLGVRERNVRVVYLRPVCAPVGRPLDRGDQRRARAPDRAGRSRRRACAPATASPFEHFVTRWWEIALASLAVPAILLLLLAEFGIGDRRWR